MHAHKNDHLNTMLLVSVIMFYSYIIIINNNIIIIILSLFYISFFVRLFFEVTAGALPKCIKRLEFKNLTINR